MPLRCIEPIGHSLQSYDLTEDQWHHLQLENRRSRHLRMPCCDAQVVLKRSSRGTKFFAHHARGPCTTAPETETHLHLKQLAVEAARASGWQVATEVSGATPTHETWTADVLAEKGAHKVAIEIQWSGQTNDESMRRQQRYRDSSVRCLWLMRQPGFPISDELPAICIGGSLESGFSAVIPSWQRMTARDRSDPGRWHQVVTMPVFLKAVFDGRFRFGVPLNAGAVVSVHSGMIDCWRHPCTARTRIVTVIQVAFGPHDHQFTVSTLGEHPELLSLVQAMLPQDPSMSRIERRFSKTQERSYVSNGCCQCGALIGEHFEHDAYYDEADVIARFPIRISEVWQAAIEHGGDHGFGWGVYL